MRGWIALAMVAVIAVGCAAGPEVVDQPDEDRLQQVLNYQVQQQDVHFHAADTEVHGTLVQPEGRDDAPGVVLIAGSGPTDRDWNNPLLPGDNGTAIELSERLAEAGIAVLRYDKRGTGHTELPGAIQWSDYLEELQQAVAALGEADGVDAENIYIAGHSEGGAHALRALEQDRLDVSGVVLLGVSGRSMQQLVTDQVTRQLEDAGMGQEAMDAELQSLNEAIEAVAAGEQVDSRHVSQIPGLVSLVETLQQEDARQFATELLGWQPTEAIARVDVPILVLHGMRDIQTDPEEDARRLYDAARESNDDVTLALIEHADHVLKHLTIDRDELTQQHALSYNDPARVLDEGALEKFAIWVLTQSGQFEE